MAQCLALTAGDGQQHRPFGSLYSHAKMKPKNNLGLEKKNRNKKMFDILSMTLKSRSIRPPLYASSHAHTHTYSPEFEVALWRLCSSWERY